MSRAEATRDEALNLMAAVQWQVGRDEAAIQALEQAIDNEHSSALPANIGVVSGGEDPAAGAHHLARLVLESSFPELCVAAALRAVDMWGSAASNFDDDDPEADMPEDLVHALRVVVAGPLGLYPFRRLVRLMASVDAEWLGRRTASSRLRTVVRWRPGSTGRGPRGSIRSLLPLQPPCGGTPTRGG